MTQLLIGFGPAGVRAMRHQLVAMSAATTALAVGDDAALETLSALKSPHTVHTVALNLPADLRAKAGWRSGFEASVLAIFDTLRTLLQAPRTICLYAELGELSSGGVAALFAREIAAMRKGHQIIGNLIRPTVGNGAEVTYLADTQLFDISHCALSLQIVAEEHMVRAGNAGVGVGLGLGLADAAAVVMWKEHLERAKLLLEASANQRRTEIGLVAINGERVRRDAKVVLGGAC